MQAATAEGTAQQQAAMAAMEQQQAAATDHTAMGQQAAVAGVLVQGDTDVALALLAAGGMEQQLAGDGAAMEQQHMLEGMRRKAMVKRKSMMRGMGLAGMALLLGTGVQQLVWHREAL
jgi:hypothetical protein